MSPPSKQLSPNAPEFIPRGYSANNVNGITSTIHHNSHVAAAQLQHHPHTHSVHQQQQHIRELPQQMNSLRLNSIGGITNNTHQQVTHSSSVQDRLQNFRQQPQITSVNVNSNHIVAQHQQHYQPNFHHHHHAQNHQQAHSQRSYNDFNGGGGMHQNHHQTNNHPQQFGGGGRYNKGERHSYNSENRRSYGGGTNVNGTHHYHPQQIQHQHHNHGTPHIRHQQQQQQPQQHSQHQPNHHTQQQSSHQVNHHHHPHHPNHHLNSVNSGNAGQHSLTATLTNNSSSPIVVPISQQQDPQQQTEEETFAVNYVESLIDCLNENPGSFDSVTANALSVFEGFGNNEYILSNAMEMIFNRSIEEQNFRYMGAKLYSLLDLIDLKESSSFRMLLTLKLEYHRNEVLKYMQNEQSKVRGTTLFLAELYMQLRNDGNRIKEIAQNIVFSINQLLRKTTPENLKCICMTLKLAGYDLEFDCPQDMSAIIQKLSNVEALDVSTSRILENVLNLQKNQWGRKAEPAISLSPSTVPLRISDEPVFYGPDGAILTEEESTFLIANLSLARGGGVTVGTGTGGCDNMSTGHYGNNMSLVDDDSDSDFDLDPEMDDETKRAYKSFLKATKQQQLVQQQQHHHHHKHL